MGIHFGVLYSADPEFKATPEQVIAIEARMEEIMHRLGFKKEELANPSITVENLDKPMLHIGMGFEKGAESRFALVVEDALRLAPGSDMYRNNLAGEASAVVEELEQLLGTELLWATYKR